MLYVVLIEALVVIEIDSEVPHKMGIQIVLNVVIAIAWALLAGEWSVPGLAVGYIAGLLIIVLFRNLFSTPLYVKTVWAMVRLLVLFLKELVLSTLAVVKQVIQPKLTMRPGIFAYHTNLTSDWEVTLLSCLITLTPGTLTLEVSPDQRTLYIHAIDIDETDKAIQHIRDSFEQAIMRVTRT